MKRILKKIISFFVEMKRLLTPNDAFFEIVSIYRKDVIKKYYKDLFNRFFFELKSASFWVSIFYNRSNGIIINLLSYFLLVPIFRLIKIIYICFKNLFYSFYYLFINFVFDLIIKYVDVYARKLRVFYERSLIDEINEVRRLFLFTDFKKNIKKVFRPARRVKVRGHIYVEEWYLRYYRIIIELLLFFIWHMPLILSFVSYLVRLFFAFIWGQFLIVFWFIAKKFMRRFKKIFNKVYYYIFFKIKLIKYRIRVIRRYSFFSRVRHSSIIRASKLFAFLKMLLGDLYSNILIWSRIKNKVMIRLRFILNYFYFFKIRSFEFLDYNKYLLKCNKLISKARKMPLDKDLLFNIFFNIKKFVDNIFINRLEPFSNYVESNNHVYNKYMISFFGSIHYKLNLESLSIMIHKFASHSINNYEKKSLNYKYKRLYYYNLRIQRFLLLIYWELFFPIYMVFYRIVVVLSFRLYIILKFFLYLLHCLLILIWRALKFIFYLAILIFFGRQK